eukprot:Gb_07021 [translate_table: standard]
MPLYILSLALLDDVVFLLSSDKLNLEPGSSGLSKGALAGILIGTIFVTTVVSAILMVIVLRRRARYRHLASRKKLLYDIADNNIAAKDEAEQEITGQHDVAGLYDNPYNPCYHRDNHRYGPYGSYAICMDRTESTRKRVKVAGVKDFTFEEMALATNNFSVSMQVGQGGYGKVYKGILGNGTIVAIKRAQEGSLQGEKEFSTEIELLSRVHHRNLVSLVGYCDDEGEQVC